MPSTARLDGLNNLKNTTLASTIVMSQPLTVTVDDTSPIIRYNPPGSISDNTKGWSVVCDAILWRCDEHSAHVTGMDGATLALTFYGTAIHLAGNVTLGMSATYTLDGNAVTSGTTADSTSQELAKFENLPLGQHTLILTTKIGGAQSTLTFDYATVVLGNVKDGTLKKQYIDAIDNSIVYGPAGTHHWSDYQLYAGTILPEGVNNETFRATRNKGATLYYKFQGSAFAYYGPCYTDTWAYTVSLDANANTQPVEYNASVPWQQVIEGCLRYFASGLSAKNADGTPADHEVLVTNSQDHWMTANWLEVWSYELTEDSSSGSGGTGGSGSSAASMMNILGFSQRAMLSDRTFASSLVGSGIFPSMVLFWSFIIRLLFV